MTSGTRFVIIFLLATVLVSQAPLWGQESQHDEQPRGTLVGAAAAQLPTNRDFTIYVGTTGFNSTYTAGITLTVNEGDSVTIRFVYNDTALPNNNPHEILIQGYNLNSGTIDRITPERTVTFTANIPGQTTFKCVVSACDGHNNLLAGVLDVQPYSGPRIPIVLSLSGQTSRGNITLYVRAVDDLGSRTPGILIHFYRNSTWGFAEIGAEPTNSSGEALLAYAPPSPGEITFKAAFTGSGIYSPNSSPPLGVPFTESTDSEGGFPYVWGQNTLVDVRMVGVPAISGLVWIGMIFLIVGSVWATYLYVVRQLLGIWEGGGGQPLTYGEQGLQVQRAISLPNAVMIGIGMVALGYADFLILTFVIPGLSLLVLPLLAFTEAVVIASMVSSKA